MLVTLPHDDDVNDLLLLGLGGEHLRRGVAEATQTPPPPPPHTSTLTVEYWSRGAPSAGMASTSPAMVVAVFSPALRHWTKDPGLSA